MQEGWTGAGARASGPTGAVRWRRPRTFDRDLIVIGAGAAGLVTAYLGAAVRARVTLIERGRMGGDCLNTGCVPSKALIRTARLMAGIRKAHRHGIHVGAVELDFAAAMDRVRGAIDRIAPHDSRERYERMGVEVVEGSARLVSPWSVAWEKPSGENGTLSGRGIVLATGAEPRVPLLPGLEEAGYLTSETLWDLRECPGRLLVLGGGAIGCELAQTFQRLGAQVTVVESGARLLPREDPEFSAIIERHLLAEGVTLHTDGEALRIENANGDRSLVLRLGGEERRIAFDAILVCVGRKPRLQGLGLETIGLDPTAERPAVNRYLQTRFASVLVCGDALGHHQFTHVAAHTAWFAMVNALFGEVKRFPVDYSVIPWVTFTDPEVARVGLNEVEARARGIPFEVTTYDIGDLDRALLDDEASGWIKVLTHPGRDRILGVTIAAAQAGEMLSEFVLAMRHGLGLGQILKTLHSYPTYSEGNRHVAGAWRRAHAPERLLRWLERWHAWRRRGFWR